MADMNIHCGLKGEYKIIRNRDGEITETDWFDNLVLNQGLNALGTQGSNIFGFLKLGTGTSTPTETQTALDSQLVSSGNIQSIGSSEVNLGAPTYGAQYTYTYSFSQGAVVGNISELGVGYSAAVGNLFSRALISDSNGNPTTISVIAIDQLTIYYRVTVYPNLTESYGTFAIDGINYNYVSKLCNASGFGGSQNTFYHGWHTPYQVLFYAETPTKPTIAGITAGGPNGNQSGTSWYQGYPYGSAGNFAYVNNSLYIDSQWNFGIQIGNATGGIGAFRFTWCNQNSFFYQIVLDQPIQKTGTKTLSLTLRFSWGRI
jgi:hypothetical protein